MQLFNRIWSEKKKNICRFACVDCGRDESQEPGSRLPSARFVGQKQKEPADRVQSQQNVHSRGQIKENAEDKTPTDPDLNGQSECDESRTGDAVFAYL